MAQSLQISDFFGSYPYIEDPLFNREISAKEEFAELEPDISEPPPARGDAYKHQKLTVIFLQWYDRLFLVHEPGTGKSCIIVHSAELFKHEHLKDPDDPTRIKRAIILIRGPALKENIRHEIVYRCTDRVYETEAVSRAPDESQRKRRIKQELKVWYDIMTYTAFVKKIREFRREEDLVEYMSNKAIYVDEAHNVPTLTDIEKQVTPSLDINAENESKYETIFRAFHKGHRNKIVLATATPMINKAIDIIPLINLLLPINSQMPFWSENEMSNLTLDQIEPYFRGRVSYVRAFETGAIPRIMGIQIPGNQTRVFPCKMSEFQYMAYLRAIQEVGGSVAERRRGRRDEFHREERYASNFVFPDGSYGSSGFEKYVERLSDGRYQIKNTPDGNYLRQLIRSDDGLSYLSDKYAKSRRLCVNSYSETDIVVDDTKGIIFVYFPDFVHGSGAVMFSLCLKEMGYEEFRTTQNIFLASQNTDPSTNRSGRPIERGARIARRRRFALLTHETSEPLISSILNTLNSYENRYGHYVQILIGARRAREGININNAVKMIMVSSGWNPSYNLQAMDRVFRALSHEIRLQEKREDIQSQGEQLREELNELRHRIESERRTLQEATGQLETSVSQNLRQLEERFQTLERNLSGADVILEVQVYSMASIYEGFEVDSEYIARFIRQYQEQQIPLSTLDSPLLLQSLGLTLADPYPVRLERVLSTDRYNTIDVQLYAKSEEKDRQIRRIFRYMKQSAYDCRINYRRNVRETDIPGSAECDYTTCQYGCAGMGDTPVVLGEDRITKILYYSQPEVEAASNHIREIFSQFYSLRIGQIHRLIQDIDDVYIDMALEIMISVNERLLDRMGFFGYLREGPNGVIYLEKDSFEIRAQPENAAYTSVLIGTQNPNNNTFNDYVFGLNMVNEFNAQDANSSFNQLIQAPIESVQFSEVLNSLSLISKVLLLEGALFERERQEETSDFHNAIISAFNHTIYYLAEPTEALHNTATAIRQRGTGRGRKRDPNKKLMLKDLRIAEDFPIPEYDPTQPGERVIIHTLLNQLTHDQTNYNVMSRSLKADGQLRILKLSEEVGWRNVNEYERIVYNTLIKRRIAQIRQYYEQFPVYGIMIPPSNKLHIRDRENENANLVDARSINMGRECTSWNRSQLIDLLYRLGESPGRDDIITTITRQQMIDYLRSQNIGTADAPLSGYPDDKLRHYYIWAQSHFSREDMCRYIRQNFERTGRIFTGRMPQYLQPRVESVGSVQISAPLTVPEYSQEQIITIEPPAPPTGPLEEDEEPEAIPEMPPINTFGPRRTHEL